LAVPSTHLLIEVLRRPVESTDYVSVEMEHVPAEHFVRFGRGRLSPLVKGVAIVVLDRTVHDEREPSEVFF
jgi:hypothetical protein